MVRILWNCCFALTLCIMLIGCPAGDTSDGETDLVSKVAIETSHARTEGESESSTDTGINSNLISIGDLCLIEMIDVPAGSVYFGCPDDEVTKIDDDPIQYELKTVDGFRLSKYEITNGNYLAFMDSAEFAGILASYKPNLSGYGEERIDGKFDKLRKEYMEDPECLELPYKITWYAECEMFVEWLATKTNLSIRIPTAVEWEYCAEGPTEYGDVKLFPWGDNGFFNEVDVEDMMLTNSGLNLGYDIYDGPAPVGSMEGDVSWCGAMDMAGNRTEITSTYVDDEVLVKGGSYQYGDTLKGHFGEFKMVAASFFTCSNSLPSNSLMLSGSGFRILVDPE